MADQKNRAWIEIDLDNLKHNVDVIKKAIPEKTKIMAVVKANATGHDSILISRKLEQYGIQDFAVASIDEGIALRKSGITGNILILGYTVMEDLEDVIKYDLIQTIVDWDYSEKIKKCNLSKKLKCHVKINTGMNRLGERFDALEKLCEIYNNDKLEILGTYSHFCVADSSQKEKIDFSNLQIDRFEQCIEFLRESDYHVGKVHLQGSYGVTNFSSMNYDFVRIGIFLYGVDNSFMAYQKNRLDLRPILSLKARIACVKNIEVGETVGYGMNFVAKSSRKVATVSIGYADGIPRNVVEHNMKVKVRDHYVKVIGSICMDQLTIDITGFDDIEPNDEVTIIDIDDESLSAVNIALKSETSVTEFLSRLGSRLPRIGV